MALSLRGALLLLSLHLTQAQRLRPRALLELGSRGGSGEAGARTPGQAKSYFVDDSELRAFSPGLGYRNSEALGDLSGPSEFAEWGSIVQGVPTPNGQWVQVRDGRYLPIEVGGKRVLVLQASLVAREGHRVLEVPLTMGADAWNGTYKAASSAAAAADAEARWAAQAQGRLRGKEPSAPASEVPASPANATPTAAPKDADAGRLQLHEGPKIASSPAGAALAVVTLSSGSEDKAASSSAATAKGDSAHCPWGYFRTAPIVWDCRGAAGTGFLQLLANGNAQAALEVPPNVRNLMFEAKATGPVSLEVQEALTQRWVITADMPSGSTKYEAATITHSRSETSPDSYTAHVQLNGKATMPLTIYAVRTPGVGKVTAGAFSTDLAYNYDAIEPCPPTPQGCQLLDSAAARKVARAWSCWVATEHSLQAPAWDALAAPSALPPPPGSSGDGETVPWYKWAEVWHRWRPEAQDAEWQMAFSVFDQDADMEISKPEFTGALSLCTADGGTDAAGFDLGGGTPQAPTTPAPGAPVAPAKTNSSSPTAAPTAAPASGVPRGLRALGVVAGVAAAALLVIMAWKHRGNCLPETPKPELPKAVVNRRPKLDGYSPVFPQASLPPPAVKERGLPVEEKREPAKEKKEAPVPVPVVETVLVPDFAAHPTGHLQSEEEKLNLVHQHVHQHIHNDLPGELKLRMPDHHQGPWTRSCYGKFNGILDCVGIGRRAPPEMTWACTCGNAVLMRDHKCPYCGTKMPATMEALTTSVHKKTEIVKHPARTEFVPAHIVTHPAWEEEREQVVHQVHKVVNLTVKDPHDQPPKVEEIHVRVPLAPVPGSPQEHPQVEEIRMKVPLIAAAHPVSPQSLEQASPASAAHPRSPPSPAQDDLVDENDPVELAFKELDYRRTDHNAFKSELAKSIYSVGVSQAVLSNLRVQLREGSVIAEMRGPVSAISALRSAPLHDVSVWGCKAVVLPRRREMQAQASRSHARDIIAGLTLPWQVAHGPPAPAAAAAAPPQVPMTSPLERLWPGSHHSSPQSHGSAEQAPQVPRAIPEHQPPPPQSSLDVLRTSLEPARASLDPARASLDAARSSLDPARASLEPARASLDAARASLAPTPASLDAARASLDEARASLEPARASLERELPRGSLELPQAAGDGGRPAQQRRLSLEMPRGSVEPRRMSLDLERPRGSYEPQEAAQVPVTVPLLLPPTASEPIPAAPPPLPPPSAAPEPEAPSLQSLPAVIQAMRERPATEQQHMQALHVVGEACRGAGDHPDPAKQDYVAHLGGADAIIHVMTEHMNSPKVLIEGCAALRGLIEDSEARQLEVCSKGGADVVIQSMRRHRNSRELLETACYVLQQLSMAHEGRQRIIRGDGVSLISQAMMEHYDEPNMQVSGMLVLGNMAFEEEVRHQIAGTGTGGYGALHTILRTMQTQWDPEHDLHIQEAAIFTVQNVCCSPELGSRMVNLGFAEAIQQAARRHPEMQEQAEETIQMLDAASPISDY